LCVQAMRASLGQALLPLETRVLACACKSAQERRAMALSSP
jgi:hypothetical protein